MRKGREFDTFVAIESSLLKTKIEMLEDRGGFKESGLFISMGDYVLHWEVDMRAHKLLNER